MPSALILIADGTEEIEFVTPYDVLTRAGFTIRSAGVHLKQKTYASCAHHTKITPDHHALSSVLTRAFPTSDILILPGGSLGASTFASDPQVQDAIRQYRSEGKWVATICAATVALVKSGGDKVKVTGYPTIKGEVEGQGWEFVSGEGGEKVVVDGKVVTSRGPGTAMEFSLAIVEALLGRAKRDEVAKAMLVDS
ncbi:DJ-1 protein [Lepidopterella palustris CBS 459.81]|uniref:D-lactate dehydratase n=1 Tax=Lepidopterella palustris CBS 459.81 TaxID=1314670 RepID=A0A8E2EDP9_9PEZI|nr:DJ-1 protein [Lepidopterella palustris CBS 459.81]